MRAMPADPPPEAGPESAPAPVTEPMPDTAALTDTLLPQFGIAAAAIERFGSGLINATWRVRDRAGRQLILQAVNPIFPAAIHDDIQVVTAHLRARGLLTPELVPTAAGALALSWEGRTWRLLNYIEGVTVEAVDPDRARQAGALLARFHRALADLDHGFANQRLGVHDTARHLAALHEALRIHAAHAEHAAVAPLAAEVFALADALAPLPPMPDRIVHGDPKITNIVFDAATGAARALIDLDTLARMPIALELGDALRSWCNPTAEDAADAAFAVELFAAAVTGYAEHAAGWLAAEEWQSLPDASATIAVELAARFCADALNESYFSWDRRRFARASAHHQARTRAQLGLARSILAQRATLAQVLDAAFA
jgi:Ser/Thr protein kinase RdoA (MazF antagonist)